MINIFDIERYATKDGPGIRMVLFFKGCNLRCAWCQNPESQVSEPQVMYYQSQCSACGKCIDACPERDTLTLSLPCKKFKLKPVAVGIIAISIFSGGSFLARQSGNWQNNISKTNYLNYMVENGLVNVEKIDDLSKLISHMDQRRKRILMRQLQNRQ